jgi:hypothetical protein
MCKSTYKTLVLVVRWYITTIKFFLSIKPWRTYRVVLFLLLSQISMLVAFLLPIKVVILLGGTGIPKYFPDLLKVLSREELIIGLSLVACIFFVIHMIADKITTKHIKSYSKFLLERNKKILFYSNQTLMSENTYGAVVRSLSGISFAIIAFFIVAKIYTYLAFIFLCYLVFMFVFVIVFTKVSIYFNQLLEEKLNEFLGVVSVIGFLSAFAYIIADFLIPINPPTLIFAVISLIFIRQMLSSTAGTINSISGLYNKRVLINGLFFEGYAKNDQLSKQEKLFWSLLKNEARDTWILQVISQVIGIKYKEVKSIWYDSGINGVAMLKVKVFENDGNSRSFIIKLFNSHHASKAINEATVLEECDLSFVTLNFIGVTQVENYHCHLFDYGEITRFPLKNLREQKLNLLKKMMVYLPPNELLERYTRAHPYLWQRLNVGMFKRLHLAADKKQIKQLLFIEEHFDNMISILSHVPVQLIFSKVTLNTLVYDHHDSLRLIHLAEWKIEPIGYGWPVNNKKNIELLMNATNELTNVRENSLADLSNSIVLVALMAEFEWLYLCQNYTSVLNLLPEILARMKIEGITGSSILQDVISENNS